MQKMFGLILKNKGSIIQNKLINKNILIPLSPKQILLLIFHQ